MPCYLEVPLDDGETVLVEITSQVDDVGPVGVGRDIVGRLESLGVGLDRVQSFASEVLGRMRAFPEPPDTVAVEFGLKLSAKTGVVIAESTGEAHLKVAAQWNRAAGPPEQDLLAE